MDEAEWEELAIDPRDLKAGDVLTYMVRDYLGDRRWKPSGVWEVLDDDYVTGSHIAVDDDGRAYDVAAVSFHCRPKEPGREEWKLFPLEDRKIWVSRRKTGLA